jgi:uncharacterized protein involved in high-affinity Fe2+ transport
MKLKMLLLVALVLSLSAGCAEVPIALIAANNAAQIYERVKPVEVKPDGTIPCSVISRVHLDGDLTGLTDDDLRAIDFNNEVIERLCP